MATEERSRDQALHPASGPFVPSSPHGAAQAEAARRRL